MYYIDNKYNIVAVIIIIIIIGSITEDSLNSQSLQTKGYYSQFLQSLFSSGINV